MKPPERRLPHVRPTRAAIPAPDEPHEPEHVLTRTEAAMNLAERRRLRRLQKATTDHMLPPAAVPRGMPVRIYISMRWFSGGIIVVLGILLYLVLTRDIFFIHEISVGGTHYLTPPEIFERSGVANMHLFWVDPAAVEAKLEADPSIANATVDVGWPPYMVQITIQEREPALIWEQSGQRVWVDVRGRVMALRQDIPKLVRVIVEKPSKNINPGKCPLMGMDEVLGPGSCIDPAIVSGVIQFKALYPSVTELVYDPARGLGYHDGRNWLLWFGDGTDLATKMAVYTRMTEEVYTKEGKQPIEFDVSDPDAPYYSVAPSR